jgi:hypothetical protein
VTILPRSRQANGPQAGRATGTPAPLLASIHPRLDDRPFSLPDIKPDDVRHTHEATFSEAVAADEIT